MTEQGIKHIVELVEKNRFIKKINLQKNIKLVASKKRILNELKQKGHKNLIVEIWKIN